MQQEQRDIGKTTNAVEATQEAIAISEKTLELLESLVEKTKKNGNTISTTVAIGDGPGGETVVSAVYEAENDEFRLVIQNDSQITLKKLESGVWRVSPFNAETGERLTSESVEEKVDFVSNAFERFATREESEGLQFTNQERAVLDTLLVEMVKSDDVRATDFNTTLDGENVMVRIERLSGDGTKMSFSVPDQNFGFVCEVSGTYPWRLQQFLPFSDAPGELALRADDPESRSKITAVLEATQQFLEAHIK